MKELILITTVHAEKKNAFYETDNICNIEVKVNNSIDDMSALSEVTLDDLFGDDFNGNNTATKDVFLGDVTLSKTMQSFIKELKDGTCLFLLLCLF